MIWGTLIKNIFIGILRSKYIWILVEEEVKKPTNGDKRETGREKVNWS